VSWPFVLILIVALAGVFVLARRHRSAHTRAAAPDIQALPPVEVRDALARRSVPLLYFTSAGSPETRRLQDPAVFMLNAEFEGRVTVIRREIGEHAMLAGQFGIVSAPSTVVFDHRGNVAAVNRGYARLEELRMQVLRARSLEWTMGA